MGKQRYRWLLLSVAIILSSAYFFIFSQSGLVERMKLDDEKKSIITRAESLKAENARLRKILDNYRAGVYPDSDMVTSGYTGPNEKIIVVHGLDTRARESTGIKKNNALFIFEIGTLRIIWIVISLLVLGTMLLYGMRIKEQQSP